MNWKECEMSKSRYILWCCARICAERLRNTKEKVRIVGIRTFIGTVYN
jgi:hypothetical protein